MKEYDKTQRLLYWLVGVPSALVAVAGIILLAVDESAGLIVFTIGLVVFLVWFFGSWARNNRSSEEELASGRGAVVPLGGEPPEMRNVRDQLAGVPDTPEEELEKERLERELAKKHGATTCAEQGHDWDIAAIGGGAWAFDCTRPDCKLEHSSDQGYTWDGQPA
jgi:hypothetical protein